MAARAGARSTPNHRGASAWSAATVGSPDDPGRTAVVPPDAAPAVSTGRPTCAPRGLLRCLDPSNTRTLDTPTDRESIRPLPKETRMTIDEDTGRAGSPTDESWPSPRQRTT